MKPTSFSIRSLRTSTLLTVCEAIVLLAFAGTPLMRAQDPLDGVWQGYDGEWRHVSAQLIALAEATPEKPAEETK